MQSKPYLPHQYNLDNLIYDSVEGSDDKRIIKIYDNKKGKPIYIQTPELTNLFGATKRSNYYELLLPLGGVSCLIFKQFMTSLQNKILLDANVNKTRWFKNIKSVKFIPLIKEVNKDVTSTMEQTEELDKCDDGMIKIKVTNGTIIKKNHEEINVNELTKGKKIRMIIQIYAVWITTVNDTTTFGIYIKPEIIEEKNSYNLEFIDEKVIFDSDSDSDSDSISSTPTCNSANSTKSSDEEIKYESK